MRHDDLLDEREAEAGAIAAGREERLEDPLPDGWVDARSVVDHMKANPSLLAVRVRVDADLRHGPRALARFHGVPDHVAHRLPEQHVVGFDGPELARQRDRAATTRDLSADVVGGAIDQFVEIDGRQAQRRGLREGQEVGDNSAERVGFVADAFDTLAILRVEIVDFDEPRISMDRGETVPELVRQAGGQLAQTGQRVLEPQLLFELGDRREIGEEADGASQFRLLVEEWRSRDTQMQGAAACNGV